MDSEKQEGKGQTPDFVAKTVDDLKDLACRWADLEERVNYVAVKALTMADDGILPLNFMVDVDEESLKLFYPENRFRRFPLEILLLVPDEAAVESVASKWLEFLPIPTNY